MVQSVNETSTKTAPQGTIDQIGYLLKRIVHAFTEAEDNKKVFMAKWEIKDGFWRLQCMDGDEWNFAYVRPQPLGMATKLVVQTSLQIRWILSPPYFCAVLETAWDVEDQHSAAPVGSLPQFVKYSTPDEREVVNTVNNSNKLK